MTKNTELFSSIQSTLPKCDFMRAGHNGPYHDPETSVRNVAHWLYVLSYFARNTNDIVLLESANNLCDYLLSSSARPMNASFYCRYNPEKDFCNGLMGQAWAIEGLLAASEFLGRKDALEAAQNVFFMHPWLENEAIWRRVSVDGSYLSPDFTFNHQLWFAAIASLLRDSEAIRRSKKFLDEVGQHVQVYNNGIIFHQSRLGELKINKNIGLKKLVKTVISESKLRSAFRILYSKSIGYHGFNLYAFALLRTHFPDHHFWLSPKFQRMLAVTKSTQFFIDLNSSIYGWPYNPPGIELAYVGEVFSMGHDYCQKWINRQFAKTYNSETGELLTRDVPDPATSSARIYESLRLTGCYNIPGDLAL